MAIGDRSDCPPAVDPTWNINSLWRRGRRPRARRINSEKMPHFGFPCVFTLPFGEGLVRSANRKHDAKHSSARSRRGRAGLASRQPRETGGRRPECRRQRMDADQLGPRADDDRSGAGALLWRSGPQRKRAGHHDAKFRPDGRHHGALGAGRLQPRLLRRETASSADWKYAFLRGVGARPMPTMPPRSRTRPSWSIS